jgi:hypothetical protein
MSKDRPTLDIACSLPWPTKPTLLEIVWQWIANSNNGLGSDVGDLMSNLSAAGYGPPQATSSRD